MVTTGSHKITVWGPGGTPLGMLRVKLDFKKATTTTQNMVSQNFTHFTHECDVSHADNI
jgi:hypothetical protein